MAEPNPHSALWPPCIHEARPNLSSAIFRNISIVPSSFPLNAIIRSSLSISRNRARSSRSLSLSLSFLFALSTSDRISSPPIKSRSETVTSGLFSRKEACIARISALFSSCLSRPGSARGTSSSKSCFSRRFAALRSRRWSSRAFSASSASCSAICQSFAEEHFRGGGVRTLLELEVLTGWEGWPYFFP